MWARNLGSFLIVILTSVASQAQVVYQQLETEYGTLEVIAQSLQSVPASEFGPTVSETQFRVIAFRVQGVLKVLSLVDDFDKNEKETVERLYDEMKSLEDAIGKMNEATDLLKVAKKKSSGSHNDKKLAALEQKVAEKSQATYDIFKNAGWLKKQPAQKRLDDLKDLKNYKGDREVKLITEAIRGQIKRYQKKIEGVLIPNFASQPFSHESMEDNFHEFRRQIRWMAIFIQSLPGIFSLTPEPANPTPAQADIFKEFRNDKYAQIDSTDSPVKIDRYHYYILASYIEKAGKAKDKAEEHFKLIESGYESDLDADQFKADMSRMMEEFMSSGIIQSLRESLL